MIAFNHPVCDVKRRADEVAIVGEPARCRFIRWPFFGGRDHNSFEPLGGQAIIWRINLFLRLCGHGFDGAA